MKQRFSVPLYIHYRTLLNDLFPLNNLGSKPFSVILRPKRCVSWLSRTSTTHNRLSENLVSFPNWELAHWWRRVTLVTLTLVNPFPHTTILQQTTLNIFCQIMENLYNWMDNLWLKVENIVTKREIARFVQFLLLLLCFQKAVCCRGVRKRLYEGKG